MGKTNRKQKCMICIMVIFLSVVILGHWLAPNDPFAINMKRAAQPPSREFLFGTDNLGRCILSQVLEAAALSVLSAVAVVAVVSVVGTIVGITAGYFGGKVDAFLMKVTVVVQVLPSFVLAVAIAGILGPGLKNALIAMILMYWTTYARLSRSLVIQIKGEQYLEAAKMCGAGHIAIILRYILPNIVSPILVTAALDIGSMMLTLAGLSFLGLGAQPPVMEWGVMISTAKNYMQTAPWFVAFPSLALFLTVLLFNRFGDMLREKNENREET